MRGMLASGLVWPSKWVGQAVMANRMHRQGLERRPQKFFAFLTSESGSPKKWCAIVHRKSSKWGVCSLQGSFDLPNGSDKPWWTTVCIDNVLTDVHDKIWHFWHRNPDHKKNDVLWHTKIVQMRGMLASGLVWPFKWVVRTVIANRMHRHGLDDVHKKIWHFWR